MILSYNPISHLNACQKFAIGLWRVSSFILRLVGSLHIITAPRYENIDSRHSDDKQYSFPHYYFATTCIICESFTFVNLSIRYQFQAKDSHCGYSYE